VHYLKTRFSDNDDHYHSPKPTLSMLNGSGGVVAVGCQRRQHLIGQQLHGPPGFVDGHGTYQWVQHHGIARIVLDVGNNCSGVMNRYRPAALTSSTVSMVSAPCMNEWTWPPPHPE